MRSFTIVCFLLSLFPALPTIALKQWFSKWSISTPGGQVDNPSGSINSHGVEWGSLNGQGVNENLLGSTGAMKPPTQNYC